MKYKVFIRNPKKHIVVVEGDVEASGPVYDKNWHSVISNHTSIPWKGDDLFKISKESKSWFGDADIKTVRYEPDEGSIMIQWEFGDPFYSTIKTALHSGGSIRIGTSFEYHCMIEMEVNDYIPFEEYQKHYMAKLGDPIKAGLRILHVVLLKREDLKHY